MYDSRTITGMQDRMHRLRSIAELTHSQEIRQLVLDLASEIEAEIKWLEAGQPPTPEETRIPPNRQS